MAQPAVTIFSCLLIILSAAKWPDLGLAYAGGMFVGRTRTLPSNSTGGGEIRRAGNHGAYARTFVVGSRLHEARWKVLKNRWRVALRE